MVWIKHRKCGNVWNYKGKNIYKAQCTRCMGIVLINDKNKASQDEIDSRSILF